MANPVPKPTKENRPKLNGLDYGDKPKSHLRIDDVYQNRQALYRRRSGLRINYEEQHDTD